MEATFFISIADSDKSIPALDSPLSVDDHAASELDKLGRLVDAASRLEPSEVAGFDDVGDAGDPVECQPPPLCHQFQTARLFLGHLGFLSLENLKVRRRFFCSKPINPFAGFSELE